MIFATKNSNKFQKTRFWKGKSVEDVITLRPMAQATLVSMNIPPPKEKESYYSVVSQSGRHLTLIHVNKGTKVPPAALVEYAFLILVCEQRPLKEP